MTATMARDERTMVRSKRFGRPIDPSRPASLFYWDREPDPAHRRAVQDLAPPADRLSHLDLFWESGTPDDPIQRWVIYQCIPIALANPLKRDGLLATDIRTASPGRMRILRYYLSTGTIAVPFWVIQGDAGGHKYRYSQQDAAWCRFLGLPELPPDPGALPYATFDQRVARRLRQYDQIHTRYASLTEQWRQGEVDQEQELRRALLRAYETETQDMVSDLSSGLPWDDLPRSRDDLPLDHADTDRIDAEYVSTGRLNLPQG